jgi:predicted Zn-dependent protease
MSDSESKLDKDVLHVTKTPTDVHIATEEFCLRELMLEPTNTMKWNALALSHLIMGNLEEAEDAVESSLDIDTSNHLTWRILGDILHLQSRNKESENAYRMALSLEPCDVHVMFQLARLCFERDAFIEATEIMMRLASVIPNDQRVWDILTNCQNIERVQEILSDRHQTAEVEKNECV